MDWLDLFTAWAIFSDRIDKESGHFKLQIGSARIKVNPYAYLNRLHVGFCLELLEFELEQAQLDWRIGRKEGKLIASLQKGDRRIRIQGDRLFKTLLEAWVLWHQTEG